MRTKNGFSLCRGLTIIASLMVLISCGSGGTSTTTTTTTTTTTSTTPNMASVTVGFGPLGASGQYVNGIFTTVTVCAPGSTSNCQTVDNVLVDTGSVGLRVLQSALGNVETALMPVTDSSSNVLQECMQFADFSYVWGPVVLANIQVAGETASTVAGATANSGVPMQIITNPATFTVPSNCLVSSGSANTPTVPANTLQALGSNGILGVENFPQDCGGNCTGSSGSVPAQYYLFPNGPGGAPISAQVPISLQVWNPVAAFVSDNNGLLITLPSVTAAGAASVTGSLIFGIGTQSNNAIGSASTYDTDSMGNFTTKYGGQTYTSFLDTGSNALYFSDSSTLSPSGIVECPGSYAGYYCPASPLAFSVTNFAATNGTQGTVTFNIANAINLFNSGLAVFNNIGGDSSNSISTDYFDFGIPFWLNRTVFVGLPTATYVNGYWAY